ncbi:MAG: hypothetical protein OEN02_00465 [Gammaproteobacteria bacterium]|nr:hypothetical protein [Gammaproteobacteria bacterium]MDH3535064.1 hypothetical protein [Gammaproteobacteria bacterium]
MQEIVSMIPVLIGIYLLMAVFLHLYQRRLIYFPLRVDPDFVGEEVVVDNHEIRLHGWV